MTDITTVWDGTRGDWVAIGTALQTGDDLTTAVLISIFTDATADPDDVIPDGGQDPRGWWGDLDQPLPIGSKLWLYSRAKQTEQTRLGVQNALSAALQWIITDGIAASVSVVAQWVQASFLGVVVTITQPTGAQRTVQFQTAWSSLS